MMARKFKRGDRVLAGRRPAVVVGSDDLNPEHYHSFGGRVPVVLLSGNVKGWIVQFNADDLVLVKQAGLNWRRK